MKRIMQLFALIIALQVLAPASHAQGNRYLIKYKGDSFVGYRQDNGKTFVTCRGIRIDLASYPELKPVPTFERCMAMYSADIDGGDSGPDLQAEEKVKVDHMLAAYKKDHPASK